MGTTASAEKNRGSSISQQTRISVGLVISVLVGALGVMTQVWGIKQDLGDEVGALRNEIIPKLTRVEVRMEAVTEAIQDFRTKAQQYSQLSTAVELLRQRLEGVEHQLQQKDK